MADLCCKNYTTDLLAYLNEQILPIRVLNPEVPIWRRLLQNLFGRIHFVHDPVLLYRSMECNHTRPYS